MDVKKYSSNEIRTIFLHLNFKIFIHRPNPFRIHVQSQQDSTVILVCSKRVVNATRHQPVFMFFRRQIKNLLPFNSKRIPSVHGRRLPILINSHFQDSLAICRRLQAKLTAALTPNKGVVRFLTCCRAN